MDIPIEMTVPQKPYLMRAIYEWILANQCTPHIMIDTSYPGTEVPPHLASEEQVIFNISPEACQGLEIDDIFTMFSGRFGADVHQVSFFNNAVMALYAKETGEGMPFSMVSDEQREGDAGILSGDEAATTPVSKDIIPPSSNDKVGNRTEDNKPVSPFRVIK